MNYDFFEHPMVGRLTLFGDDAGIRHIDFPKDRTPMPLHKEWVRNPGFFASLKAQLAAYFTGDRKTFDLLLAPEGTVFQRRVWAALLTIPFGRLVSYKAVAEKIGSPKAVRAVGLANSRNPLPIVIPCHRVIGSDGALTGFGGGIDVKLRLIRHENPGYLPKNAQRDLFAPTEVNPTTKISNCHTSG